MSEKRSAENNWVAGAVLVGIGLVALAAQLFTLTPWMVLATISALFFALWAWTRRYGFAIPAMIIGGLAAGVGWEDSLTSQSGGEVVVGLAAGFFGILVVNMLARVSAGWWPVIPGTILALIGGSLVLEQTQYAESFGQLWPVALIAVGVAILAANAMRERGTHAPKA